MSDRERSCDSGIDRWNAEVTTASERYLGDESVLDAELPADLRAALGRLVGEEERETLAEWTGAVRRRTAGDAIAVEDLCHADRETGHRGELDGETYHFRCFYDAVVLSVLAETPVSVRTESPGGTAIEMRADGDAEVVATPESAVFSFGVEESVEPPADGEPSHEDVYAAVCPYVRAFPDRDAYERWAKTVPAATVALPFESAAELATALVE